MTNHYGKFIFLAIVIVAVFFARIAYPNLSGVPMLADADQTTAPGQTIHTPPLLVLPETTVNATAQPENISAISVSNDESQTADTTPLPSFSNEAYLVGNLTTGDVAAGSNITNRWPIASITKLMTATVALDHLSPTTQITITAQMFAADPNEHTLVLGGTYSVEDLLHVMLMPSSNVAAEAMADYIGHAEFMSEMNARAQAWGMTDTYFADPSGISAANESTAQDLMTLAQHIYDEYPNVLALTNTPVTTITEVNSGRTITVRSINSFAGAPGFVGGKTGNTPQADYNLLSIFNDNGTPVFITVLGAPALPFEDTTMLYDWYKTNYK